MNILNKVYYNIKLKYFRLWGYNMLDFLDAGTKNLLVDILTVGIAVFICAKALPGVVVKDIWNAFLVALLIGIFNALLMFGLNYFHLSQIKNFLSQSIFKLIINAILLIIIDKVIKDFELKNFFNALLAAFCITLISQILKWLITVKFPIL